MRLTFVSSVPTTSVLVVPVSGLEETLVKHPSGARELRLPLGETKKLTRRQLVLLARRVVMTAKQRRLPKITVRVADFDFAHLKLEPEALGRVLAVNFQMAAYSHNEYKTRPKEGFPEVAELSVVGASPAVVRGARKGETVARELNACRRLANLPGGDVTPKTLSGEARRVARGTRIRVKVLGEREMKKLKMGGVLGVGRGSNEESQFIIMEYFAGPKKEKPLVLVGKGVTFDTGGINLKPSPALNGMNMDMSGGAAVIHALAAAARLGLKKNVVVLVPAVENMPSGSSYRPGDILRSMSGKTIEVLNTDAEGRIILADALHYAKRYDPRLVIDVATLTGTAIAALGERAVALFTADGELERRFREWGEESGDYVWPLPLWDEYEDDIRGLNGDWANTSIGKTQGGGAITAAVFLKQFADSYPWVHLDIAPRMTAVDGEFLERGAAGSPVRLLVKALESF